MSELIIKEPYQMTYQEHSEFFDRIGGRFCYAEKVGKAFEIKYVGGEPLQDKLIDGRSRLVMHRGCLPRDRWRHAVIKKAVELGYVVPVDILEEYLEYDWAKEALNERIDN